MLDRQDKGSRPNLEEVSQYVGNPVFMRFCSAIKGAYGFSIWKWTNSLCCAML